MRSDGGYSLALGHHLDEFYDASIAVNYEHKSAGIMQQLGLPEMAVDIRHLLDGSLEGKVADTLGQLPDLKHTAWGCCDTRTRTRGTHGAVGFNAY